MLALLENTVASTADLQTVVISGNVVELQFANASLDDVSRVVASLESDPLVAGVSVSTAKTDKHDDVVSTVTILLMGAYGALLVRMPRAELRRVPKVRRPGWLRAMRRVPAMRRMPAERTEPSMNRVFTTREKILLVILAILLIGCFYYLVVLKPSLDTLASSESQLSAVQDEIALQQVVATKKAELRAADQGSRSKRGRPEDAAQLRQHEKRAGQSFDAILAEASSYNIDFSNAEFAGTLVRRNVSISFTTDTYAAAQTVLEQLIDCKYSCLVTDITIKGDGLGQASSANKVTASANVTFFEALG